MVSNGQGLGLILVRSRPAARKRRYKIPGGSYACV